MEDHAGQPLLDPLTDRELEILRHIGDGQSNREIAESLFLSLNTIKWHNRQIYSKLDVGNRKQAVSRAGELDLFDAQPVEFYAAGAEPRHNLPAQVTSFVGREREVGDVGRLLESARLVTLTGPGGVGKTRLGFQVAATVVDDFVHGAYFVDLAPLRDAGLVASTIAGVLNLTEVPNERPVETLKRFLRTRQILLVLDNFEHLLAAASLLSELLEAAPGLKIPATSRENLQLSGEHVYAVPPLEQLASVELFRQRARAAKRDFDLDDTNLEVVERIAVRLDGLPLAIELAAARIVILSPLALLERLESRLDTLKGTARDLPERQQTQRATLDWSYDLLDEDEKTLFNRLGIFAGGCSLEAAEAVCNEGLQIDLFDGLESLLNKSFIWQDDGVTGETRFWMLETMREYALENLEASTSTR